MNNYLLALLFFALYELFSLPLRLALAGRIRGAGVRRLLSRLAGPLLLALPVWLAAHAWGGALAVTVGWGVWILALAGAVALNRTRLGWGGASGHGTLAAARRALGYRHWGDVALDLTTLAVFLGFVAMRRWVPEMTFQVGASGAEKFANAMFFWSNWHATSLPPRDLWMAGEPLTYYYWGHWFWAWLGRVGVVFPAGTVIALALARLVALTFESGWLLARAIGARPLWAALAALAMTAGGNWKAVEEYLAMRKAAAAGQPVNWDWYPFWNPSRAIGNIVDEFPAFSAILGDFHAHHLALPWVLGWLAVTFGRRRFGLRAAFWPVWAALALAAVLANLWNLPIIAWGVAVFAALQFHPRNILRLRGWHPAGIALAGGGLLLAALKLADGIMRAGAALPLQPSRAGGIWAKLPFSPLPARLSSTPYELWAMWGLPVAVLLIAAFLTWPGRGCREGFKSCKSALAARAAYLLPALAVLAWAWLRPDANPPLGSVLIWLGVLAATVQFAGSSWLGLEGAWLWLWAVAILIGCELVYIPDRFDFPNSDLLRYNTYFKLTYPVWGALFALAALGAQRLTRGGPWPWRVAMTALLLPFFALCFVYPRFAIPARIAQARSGDRPGRPMPPTLDAFAFIAHREERQGAAGYHPAVPLPFWREAPLLEWIRANVPPGDVVAEAGWCKAYSYSGRVASLAGRAVPMGWEHHEHQWRGTPAMARTQARRMALDRLYNAPTPEAMRAQAAELGVGWAIWGALESNLYPPSALENLRGAAAIAARAPGDEYGAPQYFLFEFRAPDPKMEPETIE